MENNTMTRRVPVNNFFAYVALLVVALLGGVAVRFAASDILALEAVVAAGMAVWAWMLVSGRSRKMDAVFSALILSAFVGAGWGGAILSGNVWYIALLVGITIPALVMFAAAWVIREKGSVTT